LSISIRKLFLFETLTNWINVSSKVFVLNNTGHDFSDAERFGKLIFVTIGNVSVFNTQRLYIEVKDFLVKHNYNPEVDYILLSGSRLDPCMPID